MTLTAAASRRRHHEGGPLVPHDTDTDTRTDTDTDADTDTTSAHVKSDPTPLVPPRRGAGRVGPEPALVPARPDLAKFRENLVRGMIAKNMTASDVARAMWGEKKNSQGNMVAKGRDRMTHYLSGSTHPNEENLKKMASILDLKVEDLAVEHDKSHLPRPLAGPTRVIGAGASLARDIATLQAALTFQIKVPGFVDVVFQQRVPQDKAFEWLEFTRRLLLSDAVPDSDKE